MDYGSIRGAFGEGYKPFPKDLVSSQAYMKPDTARGESQARKMEMIKKAITDPRTKDDAKDAVKEREQSNRKKGLEKLFKKDTDKEKEKKNKAYKLEAQRRRDLDDKLKQKAKGHPSIEEEYAALYQAYMEILEKQNGN